jgi:MFS transporter, DHA2 family, multidrug resistance protein
MATAHINSPSGTLDWRPKANPWLISIAVMLGTFMEVLDTSIANVALPHIAGNLSASTDEATWVLTSYLVSNAVVLPATGWLGRFFGRRRFLISCMIIFTLASALCGMANSLGFLILARILQGAGGGALQPIAQAVLFESFPPEKRGTAMSFYAMGVVVAPILGPTVGGWLTDDFSWRWAFYINLPIGILAVLLCFLFLEDPPYLKDQKAGSIDYIGFGLLTLWIACLQIMLDKGQDEDWFSSNFICWLAVGAFVGFIAFLVWEMRVKNPIVNLRVLTDRNLAVGAGLNLAIGAILYGTTSVLPQFLQNLLGYPAFQSGLVMSPRGIGAIIGSVVSGRIMAKIDGRAWMVGGVMLLSYSMFLLGGLTLEAAPANVIWPIILSGFAVTSIFVPMSTFSMTTIKREYTGDATGLTSLLRNLGGSIGISVLTTLIYRSSVAHQALMVGHLTPYDAPYREKLQILKGALASQSGATTAQGQAYGVIYQTLHEQAQLFSYIDQFRMLIIACLCCAPLVLLLKKDSEAGQKPSMNH